MTLGILICLVAIVSAKVADHPSDLDAIRLISISKSAKLTELLSECAELPDLLHNTIAYDRETDRLVTGSEAVQIGLLPNDSQPV
jgi:hypothetical protein